MNFQIGDKVKIMAHNTRKYKNQIGTVQAFCGSEDHPGAVVLVDGEAPIVSLVDLKPVRRR